MSNFKTAESLIDGLPGEVAEVTTAEETTEEVTTAEVTTAEITTAEITTAEITTAQEMTAANKETEPAATTEAPKSSSSCGSAVSFVGVAVLAIFGTAICFKKH